MSEINGNISAVEQITGNLYPKGEKGNGIDRIERISRVGLVDTYSIYFTDGTSKTFTVTNGEKGDTGDTGPKGDPGDVSLEQLNTAVGNATKTTQTTEVSEELTINNCAGVKGKLDIKSGKSEQDTRSGKNLLNIPSFTNGEREGINFTAKYNESGSLEYINAVGNSTTGYRDIMRVNISSLPAGNYILSGLNTNSVVRFVLLKAGDTNAKKLENSGEVSFTQDSSSPYTILRIDIYQTGAINCRITPMIRKSTETDDTYEPYGASPSPDYPSRIRNVGDNINEFSSELELGEISNDTGINSINTNSIRTKDYIKVKPNTTYTIKNSNNYMNVIYFYKKDKTYINYSYSTETSYTFTTGPTAEYIRVRSSSTKKENDLTTKYKLEKGSIATPYTPYSCRSIDYLARNKNLAFLEFSNKVRGYGNGNLTNSDIYDTYKAIVEENTKYTVSFVGNDNNVSNLCYFDKSMNYIKGNPFNSNNPRILTTPQNCKYITLAVMNTTTNFMIEKGNTKTEYIEHKEQNIHFPLSEGQLLHKGDYLASDGIHQKRKTLVLDGTETITEVSNNRFQIALPLKAGDGYQKIISLCSHFKSITQLEIISTTNNNVVAVNGNYVYFRVNSEETLDNFKNRLAEQYANGTPVIIEYELAEEIVIPYTPEQEESYYELQHLLMYEGYTNISCIDEIKPDICLEYYFNNEVNKTYCKRIDSLEEKIRLLEKAVSSQSGVNG